MKTDIAIIIPTYRRNDLITMLIADLSREQGEFDLLVVDNGGDFCDSSFPIEVTSPGENIGWARGCNLGIELCFSRGYKQVMLLNNDVHLSRNFVTGMIEAAHSSSAGILGPVYDHNWPQQNIGYRGTADEYNPRPMEHEVPFIDGTCMLISRATIESIGLLDVHTWPHFGWGCDKDYCLRARLCGESVHVTERSYLNHFARQTAADQPDFSELAAEDENDSGMRAKWGERWEDILYLGFPKVRRKGTVQIELGR
ncbi:glycosyltransferase [Nocardia salmonicida]|uniref:glycosyltransferase n=1 Tax=Nocardia salmonicida TaxID=53431 RepID=UPI000A7E8834|nr:glycosyltransferase family 2 protein [Nocardia salmonicida]